MEITLAARRRRGAWSIVLWRRFILVAKRSKHVNNSGQWNFPGGNIDKGESPKKAALRELQEEVGIPQSKIKVLHKFNYRLGARHTTWAFILNVAGKRPKIKLNPQESSKFQWMPLWKLRKAIKSNPNGWHPPTVALMKKPDLVSAIDAAIKEGRKEGKKAAEKKAERKKQQQQNNPQQPQQLQPLNAPALNGGKNNNNNNKPQKRNWVTKKNGKKPASKRQNRRKRGRRRAAAII